MIWGVLALHASDAPTLSSTGPDVFYIYGLC